MVEENGRIPFTFARKKYLETESGIYPTHVCETMFPSWKILTNFRIREGSSIFLARFPFGWKGFNRHDRMKRMEKGKGRSKGVIELFRDRNFSTRNGGGGKTGHGRSMTEGCRNHPLGYAGSCVGA